MGVVGFLGALRKGGWQATKDPTGPRISRNEQVRRLVTVPQPWLRPPRISPSQLKWEVRNLRP